MGKCWTMVRMALLWKVGEKLGAARDKGWESEGGVERRADTVVLGGIWGERTKIFMMV